MPRRRFFHSTGRQFDVSVGAAFFFGSDEVDPIDGPAGFADPFSFVEF
jgi:hypothetical protein